MNSLSAVLYRFFTRGEKDDTLTNSCENEGIWIGLSGLRYALYFDMLGI